MIIPEKERSDWGQLFDYIYQGHEAAKSLSFEILELVHIWDDLYDQDNPASPEDVNKAFFSAIYGLQNNPIWKACDLNTHMLNVIFRWHDANVLEQSKDEEDWHKAYMLRAGVYDLFVIIAFHLLGQEWARKIGPMVRRFYSETLSDFVEEVKSCQAAA